jgi:hypothetical protein
MSAQSTHEHEAGSIILSTTADTGSLPTGGPRAVIDASQSSRGVALTASAEAQIPATLSLPPPHCHRMLFNTTTCLDYGDSIVFPGGNFIIDGP